MRGRIKMVSCLVIYAHEERADGEKLNQGSIAHRKAIDEIISAISNVGLNISSNVELDVFSDFKKDSPGQVITDAHARIDITHESTVDFVLVIGTPALKKKYAQTNTVIRTQLDMVHKRMSIEDEVIKKHGLQVQRSVIPVLLEGTREASFPDFLDNLTYLDMRDDSKDLSHQISRLISIMLLPEEKYCLYFWRQQDAIKKASVLHNLPLQRNPFFTGREEALEVIRNMLRSKGEGALAISGLGGVGKTQLVKEYASRALDNYQLIWWINASDYNSFIQDYMRLAESVQLKVDEKTEPTIIIQSIHARLNKDDIRNWLIIYDNLNPEDYKAWLPQGLPIRRGANKQQGHILITSRSSHFNASITLTTFSTMEALEYLDKLLPGHSKEEKMELSHSLGRLPLALVHAAAYIKCQCISIRDYIVLFKEQQSKMLHDTPMSQIVLDSYRSLGNTTIQIALDTINKTEKIEAALALECIQIGSVLASEFVPMEFYQAYTDSKKLESKITLIKAIDLLENYGLIACEKIEGIAGVMMHELVQQVIASGLTPEQYYERLRDAVLQLTVCYNKEIADPYYKLWVHYLPHAMKLVELGMRAADNSKTEQKQALWKMLEDLCMNVSSRCQDTGKYRESLFYGEYSFKICQLLYGEEHIEVARSLNNLGRAWSCLGEHYKAIAYYKQAFTVQQAVSKETATANMANILNNLGNTWLDLGNFIEGRECFEKALSAQSAVYGENTYNTAIADTLNNLGNLHAAAGNVHKALDYFERVLAMYRVLYGMEYHPAVLATLNNLGNAYAALGELDRGLAYYENALSFSLKIYGSEINITVARTLSNLGTIYLQQHNLSTAIKYYEKALAIKQAIYGIDAANNDIANTLINLGNVWLIVGKSDKAIAYNNQALSMKRQIYGQDNADVAVILLNIANCEREQGNYVEALKKWEYSVNLFSKDLTQNFAYKQQVIALGTEILLRTVTLIQQSTTLEGKNFDWEMVNKGYEVLLALSPVAVMHHNYASLLHIQEINKKQVGKIAEAGTLAAKAFYNFQKALAIEANKSTLVEFGQFLYLHQQPDKAYSYLHDALIYPEDEALLTYNGMEFTTLIPALQLQIAQCQSIGDQDSTISVRPRVLACVLLLLIGKYSNEASQSITSSNIPAMDYLRLLHKEVQKHPNPVHYGLLAYACEAVGLVKLASHNQQRSERLWQSRSFISEEKKAILADYFTSDHHLEHLISIQTNWREKVNQRLLNIESLSV